MVESLGLASSAPWTAPLGAMLLGACVAVVVALRTLRAQVALPVPGRTRHDVEAELDWRLSALRDLEERAAQRNADELGVERRALEAEAAALWDELHAMPLQPAAQSQTPPSGRALSPAWQGAMWGALVTGLGAFLVVTVQQDSTPRAPPAAPAPVAAPGGDVPSQAWAELHQRLQRDPNDVGTLLELGHQLLRAQMLDEARTLTERALRLSPNNLEALTHAAVLQASQGDGQGAQAGLAMVLRKDPQFVEAWFFRGMLAMQSGDLSLMRQSLGQFVRYAPDGPQKERAKAMLMRAESANP